MTEMETGMSTVAPQEHDGNGYNCGHCSGPRMNMMEMATAKPQDEHDGRGNDHGHCGPAMEAAMPGIAN